MLRLTPVSFENHVRLQCFDVEIHSQRGGIYGLPRPFFVLDSD